MLGGKPDKSDQDLRHFYQFLTQGINIGTEENAAPAACHTRVDAAERQLHRRDLDAEGDPPEVG
jgi:hypothetical protein